MRKVLFGSGRKLCCCKELHNKHFSEHLYTLLMKNNYILVLYYWLIATILANKPVHRFSNNLLLLSAHMAMFIKKDKNHKKWTLNEPEIKEVGKSLLFFGVTICFLCLNACQKTNPTLPYVEPPIHINYWDTLPAITQEGRNTIGCLVNGKVSVPHGVSIGGPGTYSTFGLVMVKSIPRPIGVVVMES